MFSSTKFSNASFAQQNTQAFPLGLPSDQSRRRHPVPDIQRVDDQLLRAPLPSVLASRPPPSPISQASSSPLPGFSGHGSKADSREESRRSLSPPPRKVQILESRADSGHDDSMVIPSEEPLASSVTVRMPAPELVSSEQTHESEDPTVVVPAPRGLSMLDYQPGTMRLLPSTLAVKSSVDDSPYPQFAVHRADLEMCLTGFLEDYGDQRRLSGMMFSKDLQLAVAKVFSPRPEPPHFTKDDADQLFLSVCKEIGEVLSRTDNQQESLRDRIKQATTVALAMIEGLSFDQSEAVNDDGEPSVALSNHITVQVSDDSESKSEEEWSSAVVSIQQSSAASVSSKTSSPTTAAESTTPCYRMITPPVTMNIEKKRHSQPLPGKMAAKYRWTLVYLIHKYQPHYHTSQQLRFVEHVPGTLAGDTLANHLYTAAKRGLRLQLVKGADGDEVVNWHPLLPAHEDRNKPFPANGIPRLQVVLNRLL